MQRLFRGKCDRKSDMIITLVILEKFCICFSSRESDKNRETRKYSGVNRASVSAVEQTHTFSEMRKFLLWFP